MMKKMIIAAKLIIMMVMKTIMIGTVILTYIQLDTLLLSHIRGSLTKTILISTIKYRISTSEYVGIP